MGKKLRTFIEKHWDILSYLFFGGLTTVVSFVTYTLLYQYAGLSATVSNVISWVAAVAFAYVTNKLFVFSSRDWSWAAVLPELGKFVLCRVGSGAAETGILLLTVDYLGWDGNWLKLFTGVLVIVLNYVGSKLLVFRKQ